MSQLQRKTPPPYRIHQIGLIRPRTTLFARIDSRIDAMLEAGLVQEVMDLAEKGYDWDLPSMSALGYKQIGLYLQGKLSLADSIQLIRKETRRVAR